MKPARFRLHTPATVADACAVLAGHGEEAKLIAGGQSLTPLLALRLVRVEHLVDLNRVAELSRIEEDDDSVTIGALVRQADADGSAVVARTAPLVARALPLIGHFQIRNRGTVGGSLAHADPASELPAVALALDAELVVTGPAGTRSIPASDFFLGLWTTALASDEVLVGVRFPAPGPRWGGAVEEVARRHGDFAMVGVAAALNLGPDDRVTRARVALFGVASTPLRAAQAEAALVGVSPSDLSAPALGEIAALAIAGLDPPEDVHATAGYRRQVAGLLTARALTAALQEATDG